MVVWEVRKSGSDMCEMAGCGVRKCAHCGSSFCCYIVIYLLCFRKWILNARNLSLALKLPISIIVENLFII